MQGNKTQAVIEPLHRSFMASAGVADSFMAFLVLALVPARLFAAPLMSTDHASQVLGDQGQADFGESAITAGDVNGDGFSDLLVGSPLYDNGHTNEGKAQLFLGTPSGFAPTPLVQWESDETGAFFGQSVTCLGDVTGDGFDDIAVGSPHYGGNDGAVFFYKGSASGPPGGANRTILGDSNDGGFGGSVAAAGDVNNDGFPDLIAGGSTFSNGQANEGRALVYLATGGTLSTTPAWQVESNQVGVLFGETVAGAGDVNGDGFDDVLVNAPLWSNGQASEGKAFLYLGSSSGVATTPAWQIEGNQTNALLGFSLAGAGDVNGDGFADFLVGASRYDNGNADEGRAYLFLGTSGTISTTPARTYEGGEDGALLGTSVGTAGDVNGDGFADFVIGAQGAAAGGVGRGKVQLYLGGTSLPSSPALTYQGQQDTSEFGAQAITAGDTDGDGFSDIMVGAPSYNGTVTDGGAVFLYRGAAAPPSTTAQFAQFGVSDGDWYGAQVAVVGDVNADGFDDALVVAALEAVPGRRDGMARLYKGSESGLSPGSRTFPSPILIDTNGHWGSGIASAGDVNADGFDDFLIGDYLEGSVAFAAGIAVLYAGNASTPTALQTWNGDASEGIGFAMTSGDFDGDGFFDVVFGGGGYAESRGRTRVYSGGPSGPDLFSDWVVEGGSPEQRLGIYVARAGDVNRDGYDDLLVRSHNVPGSVDARGRVELYLGSFNGLLSTPAWSRDGTVANQLYGAALCAAGDVNGDGFADVAIGSEHSSSADGRVEVFLGNGSGLETTPAFVALGLPTENGFGKSISSAGDLNLDGYSDLLVGVNNFITGDGGRALVYLGSASGLNAAPAWVAAPASYEDRLGDSVSGGGDFNADGYSDFILGAPLGESGEFNAPGFAATYLGNEGAAVDRNVMQLASSGGERIATGARNPLVVTSIAVRSFLRSAAGRSNVRLQVAARASGLGFGSPTHTAPAFLDTGAPVAGEGSALTDTQTLVGFSTGISYHWRYRAQCTNPFFPHSPWLSPQGNSPAEADVRMRPITTDAPSGEGFAGLRFDVPTPNPMASAADLAYSLPMAAYVRLNIYDIQGRLVQELADGRFDAGDHQGSWDGRDARGGLVPSGVYFGRLEVGNRVASQKIVVER